MECDKEESRIKNYINDENIIQGILFDDEELKRLRKEFGVKENKEIKIFWKKEVPRVVIDRKTSASNIYHFGEVSFAKDCGLYFLIDLRMKEYCSYKSALGRKNWRRPNLW